jgi:4-hydroxy-tetrahydrodipicolinate synthase
VKQSLGTILTAMVTPFKDDLTVDAKALERLADDLLINGSDGLVVAGTTGECPTLTDGEKVAMFRAVVGAAGGRGAVIANTGSNDTRHSVDMTRKAEQAGVDGVLVVTPYYNKPPQRGLVAHFRAVAAATSLPLIIYNIPSRCVVNLSPETLAELSAIENVVAVKQANPDLDQSRRLLQLCDLGLYAGSDDLLLDVAKLGGWGGICVASHLVGHQMGSLVEAVRADDLATAEDLNERLLAPLYVALSVTVNPIPVKCALGLIGRSVGGLRLPLVDASADERGAIADELRRLGLLS